MLDRRSFLTAALGAATFPMPALARAEVQLTRTRAVYPLINPALRDVISSTASNSLTRLPTGPLLAAWHDIVLDAEPGPAQVVLRRYNLDLEPISPPMPAGQSFNPIDLVVTTTGGLLALGGPTCHLRPLTFSGGLAGPEVKLTRDRKRFDAITCTLCPLGNGTTLAAWSIYLHEPKARGVLAAIVGADGRRRSRFSWVVSPVRQPMQSVTTVALIPVGGGVVGIFKKEETVTRFLLRRMDVFGTWGPPRELAVTANSSIFYERHPSFAAVGLDRVAGFWMDGFVLRGALFTLDGSRLVTFEPAEVELPLLSVAPRAKAIIPLSGGRLLSLLGPVVYDGATGRILSRPVVGDMDTGATTAVVSLGPHRFARSTFQSEPKTPMLEVISVNG